MKKIKERSITRARVAVDQYSKTDIIAGNLDDLESTAIDIITDMLHLVKSEDGDPEMVIRAAKGHYEEEKE